MTNKIILPNTCIVCQITHKENIPNSDLIVYIDSVNKRLVCCNEFNVYPFYKKAFVNTNINELKQ